MKKRAAELKRKLDGLYEEIRKRDIMELHIIVEETIEAELTAAVREERGKRDVVEKAARKYLEAEDIQFGLEIQTWPKATQVEKNRAHNAVVLARDDLAALTEEK